MKHITKLVSLGAVIAAFGATIAVADDSQLQNRLLLQRAQSPEASRSSTVAVYSNRRGLSSGGAAQDERSESRFELRANAHGQTFGAYAAAK